MEFDVQRVLPDTLEITSEHSLTLRYYEADAAISKCTAVETHRIAVGPGEVSFVVGGQFPFRLRWTGTKIFNANDDSFMMDLSGD